MSDGIHDSQKQSDEIKAQSAIAKAVLLFLENPTPQAKIVLEDIIRNSLEPLGDGNPDSVLHAVKRLEENDSSEWLRFFHSSPFAWQDDGFKNRFLVLAKNKNIDGF